MILTASHTESAFAGEIDLCDIPSAADDMISASEFRVRASRKNAFHLDVRQRDKIVLVKLIDVHDSVANLLNIDRAAEGYLLSRVALCSNAMLLVPQITCCDGGVMTDLLANQSALLSFFSTFAQEKLTEESVQWFLDAIARVAAGILLPAQAG